MPSTKNGKEKTKLNKKQTNYEVYKEKIVKFAQQGSFCGTCLARKLCDKIEDVKQKGSDAFCENVLLTWCNQEYKEKK